MTVKEIASVLDKDIGKLVLQVTKLIKQIMTIWPAWYKRPKAPL